MDNQLSCSDEQAPETEAKQSSEVSKNHYETTAFHG